MKSYLPIGSVVLLKGATKRLMIYGRKQINASNGKNFDYVGCLYPEGNIGPEYTIFFNEDMINKVFFEGFKDEEEEKFNKFLVDIDNEK